MPRNTGGSYTLPGGDFVTGSVISSTVMNQKFNDLTTAMSESLSRSGNGGMIVPLKLPDGSAALPSMTWTSDPGSGFYLSAISAFRAVILAATVQEWTNTSVSINKALTVNSTLTVAGANATTLGGTLTVTGATTVNSTLTATGAATLAGVTSSAALPASGTVQSSAHALTATGAGNSSGLNYPLFSLRHSMGGNASGLVARLASTATVTSWVQTKVGWSADVDAVIGAMGQLWFTPSSVQVTGPNAATASVVNAALALTNGHLSLDGVTSPSSTVAVKNALTPGNICKAWARVTTNGASGSQTVAAGFNIASATITGNRLVLTFAQAFASSVFAVSPSINDTKLAWSQAQTSSTVTIEVSELSAGSWVQTNLSGGVYTINVLCFGAQ